MNELPNFRYFVSLSAAETRRSFFQLFEGSWLAAMDYIAQIVQCPATIADLYFDVRRRVQLRVSGRARYWIAVAPPGTVDRLHHPPPFMVLFTSSETDEWGRQFVRRHREPVLHVPEHAHPTETSRGQLSRDCFEKFADVVLDHMMLYDPVHVPLIRASRSEPREHLDLPSIRVPSYIRTAPNYGAVMSAGYPSVELVDHPDPQDKSDVAARRAFEAVASFRKAFGDTDAYPPGLTCLLIAAAGMSRRLPGVLKGRSNDPEFKQALRAFQLMRRFRALDLIPAELWTEFRDSPIATSCLGEREFEIRGHATAALVEACSLLVPTVLLQNGLGRPLRDRGLVLDSLRHRGDGWRKRDLDTFRSIGRDLASAVPAYVMDYLRSEHGTVKAFVDEPIELMAMEGRPLSMARPVIRVPVTPGSLLSRHAAMACPLFVDRHDFDEILILRGTQPGDPVYPWLELFACRMAQQAPGVSIRTIDVRTHTDVKEALEQFEGAMMAVDAHGVHLAGQMGHLQVGDESLTMHALGAPLPPIIFLACCETHAIGRSEETVAAALLHAGARCVIGTLTSVSAQSAGLLFSDLVGRATHWQPAYSGPLRWSDLCAASMWVCHAMEAATVLSRAGVVSLSPVQVGEFADRLEQHLLRFHRDWFAVACHELAKMASVDDSVVKREWLRRAYVTDCAMFCQLGQSDSIFVTALSDREGELASRGSG